MRGKPKRDDWPKQFHGPAGESAWFNEAMYVPLGWTPYPQIRPAIPEEPVKQLDREELMEQLKAKGIKINPQWCNAVMEQILSES